MKYIKIMNDKSNNSIERLIPLEEDCRLIDATYTLNMLKKYCDANCKYTECERDVMCRACPIGDAIEIVEDTPIVFEVKE